MVGGSMKKKGSFLESIVMAAIVLVLIQTFLEDWAVIAGWSWDVRQIMVFTGFFFDLFFTIEFFTRLYFAVYRGKVKEYFLYERGWIDFLASIPLLVLNSGPSALAVLAGTTFTASAGGILNILKVVKAIRIARILRLLRLLKIFKQIKNAESPMAQRHVARITTISISMLVFSLFFFTALSGPLGFPSIEDVFDLEKESVIRNIPANADRDTDLLKEYASREKSLLIVRHHGETLYTRYDNHFYRQWYGPRGLRLYRPGGVGIFLRHLERRGGPCQAEHHVLHHRGPDGPGVCLLLQSPLRPYHQRSCSCNAQGAG